jgi:UDP-N-acetylglucosamine 2-epimerase
LFFIPIGNALAAKFWGIMPKNPWTLGGGAATCMAVESSRLKKMFTEQGVPEHKMVVTGKPSVDHIYTLMQRADVDKMYQEWGVTRKQKVILCSVPQLAEHGLLPWKEHWQEIDFLFATLTAQPDSVVILSLHPKSDPIQYKPLAEKYGAIIAKQRIYALLPACDIFVATYSSTVVQAIGIGKPTIVVDFYDLNYTLYDDVPGVTVVNQRKQFGVTLNRLVTDHEYYERLSQHQWESGSEWVLLDGQCTRRVVDLIKQLAESRVSL